MADGNSSGFFGVIIGALIVVVLVAGYFVYAGHGTGQQALNVHVSAPAIHTPG